MNFRLFWLSDVVWAFYACTTPSVGNEIHSAVRHYCQVIRVHAISRLSSAGKSLNLSIPVFFTEILMQRIAVNQLQEGDIINQIFVLTEKVLGTTSTTKQFLRAECLDSTGKIHCRMWNISRDVYDKIKSPGFVQIKGRIEVYQGHLQLIAEAISAVENPEKINRADFLPATKKNVPEILNRPLIWTKPGDLILS